VLLIYIRVARNMLFAERFIRTIVFKYEDTYCIYRCKYLVSRSMYFIEIETLYTFFF